MNRINYIFAKSPVITSAGECMHSPLLEQTAGHHVALDVFEYLSQDLVTRLRAASLDCRQSLVET